jgi:L-2,4-diaminobutyric acid acetyltransferase
MPGSTITSARQAAGIAVPETRARIAGAARLRAPRVEDAAAIWQLVRSDPHLDENSPYAYLLLCSHFAASGLVAEDDSGLVGFVLGYEVPDRSEVLFVWQLGVAPAHRGRGLGGRMLDALVARLACRGVRALEATVTPENLASQALFAGFARRAGAALHEGMAFPAQLFPLAHGEERLLHIGPLHSTTGRAHTEEA